MPSRSAFSCSRTSAATVVPSIARTWSTMPSDRLSSAPALLVVLGGLMKEIVRRPLVEPLDPAQHAGEQLDLPERHVLVEPAKHVVHVHAQLDQLGSHAMGLRGRVRVLEAAGVGHERDVERLRDLRRQLHAEVLGEAEEDLGGAGCFATTRFAVPKWVLSWW